MTRKLLNVVFTLGLFLCVQPLEAADPFKNTKDWEFTDKATTPAKIANEIKEKIEDKEKLNAISKANKPIDDDLISLLDKYATPEIANSARNSKGTPLKEAKHDGKKMHIVVAGVVGEFDKRQTQVQSLINRHKAEKPVGIGGQAIKLHEWPDFKKHMKPADDDVADEAAAFDLFG